MRSKKKEKKKKKHEHDDEEEELFYLSLFKLSFSMLKEIKREKIIKLIKDNNFF